MTSGGQVILSRRGSPRPRRDRRARAVRHRPRVGGPDRSSASSADAAMRCSARCSRWTSLNTARGRATGALRVIAAPGWGAGRVEVGGTCSPSIAANAMSTHRATPASGHGRLSRAKNPTARVSSGWPRSSPPIMRQWNSSEYSGNRAKPRRRPSSTAISDDGLHLDAGLLVHLFHRNLRRRVADVGPPDRVQPHAGVGALGEQQLALLVPDDGGDRHLRRDVAGDALADRREPFVVTALGLGLFDRRGANVGRDLEHLVEALLLVEALRERRGRCARCPTASRPTGADLRRTGRTDRSQPAGARASTGSSARYPSGAVASSPACTLARSRRTTSRISGTVSRSWRASSGSTSEASISPRVTSISRSESCCPNHSIGSAASSSSHSRLPGSHPRKRGWWCVRSWLPGAPATVSRQVDRARSGAPPRWAAPSRSSRVARAAR